MSTIEQLKPAPILYPDAVQDGADRFVWLNGLLEALREKHNGRAGNFSGEAVAYRDECRRLRFSLVEDILKYGPADESKFSALEQEGFASKQRVSLEDALGVDLAAFDAKAELPPDPLEDLTAYTEVDPNNRIAVTSTSAAGVLLTNNEDACLYKDCGAVHFGVGITHYLDADATYFADRYSGAGVWGVSNAIDDFQGLYNANAQAMTLHLEKTDDSGTRTFYFRSCEPKNQAGSSFHPTARTYITISRPSETSWTADLYSDSGRTILEQTLARNCVSGRRFRYIFALSSLNSGNANRKTTIDASNLDIGEAGPAQSPCPRVMHQARMRSIA